MATLARNVLGNFFRGFVCNLSGKPCRMLQPTLNPSKPQLLNSYNQAQQTRGRYVNWRMRRDALKREDVKEEFSERLRYRAMKKNQALTKEMQKEAVSEMTNKLKRSSNPVQLVPRCVATSRPRGVMKKWRINRIVWRKIVDYNQMSGIKRGMW